MDTAEKRESQVGGEDLQAHLVQSQAADTVEERTNLVTVEEDLTVLM